MDREAVLKTLEESVFKARLDREQAASRFHRVIRAETSGANVVRSASEEYKAASDALAEALVQLSNFITAEI